MKYLILTILLLILSCNFENEDKKSEDIFIAKSMFDLSGENMASPLTLKFAKIVKTITDEVHEKKIVFTDSLINNILETRLPIGNWTTPNNRELCKVLKVDSNYYEILFFPFYKEKRKSEYFLLTPDSIYNLKFQPVINEEVILSNPAIQEYIEENY